MTTPERAAPRTRAADSVRRRRGAAFFVVYLLATGFPGIVPFNRVEPTILGVPFVLAWIVAWILGVSLVLWALERGEDR